MKTTVLCTLMMLSLLSTSFAAIASDSGKVRNVRQFAATSVDNFGNLQVPGMAVPLDAYGNPVGSQVDAYGNPVAMAAPVSQQVIVQEKPKSPYSNPANGALGGLFATFFG